MSTSRREFLRLAAASSLGFAALQNFIACGPAAESQSAVAFTGYGSLVSDPAKLLNLPEGFQAQVISRWGEPMADGLLVPNRADGMATFSHPNGKVILIRNHEISPNDAASGAFGEQNEQLSKLAPEWFYDFGKGKMPGLGGTTTVVYDEEKGSVVRQFLSLAGTSRNCAGGPTPWGSWLTCEETTDRAGEDENERDHGYVFEVPASLDIQRAKPLPIKAMGRFNHEAVCLDPGTGIVYLTEDRHDGLIYRFIPAEPGNLHAGGKLQALVLLDRASADTRNWPETGAEAMPVQEFLPVRWVDLDEVEAPEDDLRQRGHAAGAAIFARGEGMWYGQGECYWACTNGGRKQTGQVFRYLPSAYEGTAREAEAPGQVQLFAEPNDSAIVNHCDNLTVAPNGDLYLCEDTGDPRIIGLTQKGEFFTFGLNVGHPDSELTGACFSPSGKTMFVNIQHYGLTFAITGPWRHLQA